MSISGRLITSSLLLVSLVSGTAHARTLMLVSGLGFYERLGYEMKGNRNTT